MRHKRRTKGHFEPKTRVTQRPNLSVPKGQKEGLRKYKGEDRIVSASKMAQYLKEKEPTLITVKSLIPSLDALIGGFQEGELIIISGPPKAGKTLLAQTLTVNFNEQNRYPLWFSYEVPVRQFFSQFPSRPIIYLPRQLKPQGLDWLRDRIRECYLKHKTRIIFIDHLHYLVDMSMIRNSSLEIGTVIRELKTLAVQGRFIIFLLAHMTKWKSGTMSYENIRDSSFIPQESDLVLMIKRTPKIAENAAELQIELHRRTGVQGKSVALVKFKGLLVERSKLPPNLGAVEHSRIRKGERKSGRIQSGDRQGEGEEETEDQ